MLRIAAIYLITLGVVGLFLPFLGDGAYYPEAISHTLIGSIKIFSRELCLALALIIGGVGILKKQLWSRKVCLCALGLAFFYGGNIIGWQYADGKPSAQILIGAYGLSFLLFGIWFLLLFQQLTKKSLEHPGNHNPEYRT